MARGEYYKWSAHDDVIAPTYLQRCVATLDAAGESAILCFPRRRFLSNDGRKLVGAAHETMLGASAEPAEGQSQLWERIDNFDSFTYRDLLDLQGSWFPMFAFALMRASALKKTRLIDDFAAADLVMVFELRMLGGFLEVPEELYFQRLHPPTGWTMRKSDNEEASWYNPARRVGLLPPRARLYLEYFRSIGRAHIRPVAKVMRFRDLCGKLGYALCRRALRPLLNNEQQKLIYPGGVQTKFLTEGLP